MQRFRVVSLFCDSALNPCACCHSVGTEAMRTSEFDTSSEDEEVGEEQLTPFCISW